MTSARRAGAIRQDFSLLTSEDLGLFTEGRHYRLWEKLGSHAADPGEGPGVFFAVWAPSARAVQVVGDFNGWQGAAHPLAVRGTSGVWEGFVPGLGVGERYRYRIQAEDGSWRENTQWRPTWSCRCPTRASSQPSATQRKPVSRLPWG